MKKLIFTLATALFMTSCQQKPESYVVEGSIEGVTDGIIYLKSFRNKMFFTEDSAEIKNGSFCFEGTVQQPLLYGLQTGAMRYPAQFFLENTHMKVSINTDGEVTEVLNSPENAIFQSNAPIAVQEGFNIDSLVTKYPASPSVAYFLYRYFTYQLPLDSLKATRGKLSASLADCPYVQELDGIIRKLEKVQVGQVAPDFTLPDTAGVNVSLSDFRGKYVLVDFWASWCPYCRKENPSIVDAFRKYKDKNFTVLGVSLDRDKGNWLDAIEKDNLTWTHVSDLKHWDAEVPALYGVRGIPSNVLLDPEGMIIARDIHEAELHAKLAEILK